MTGDDVNRNTESNDTVQLSKYNQIIGERYK